VDPGDSGWVALVKAARNLWRKIPRDRDSDPLLSALADAAALHDHYQALRYGHGRKLSVAERAAIRERCASYAEHVAAYENLLQQLKDQAVLLQDMAQALCDLERLYRFRDPPVLPSIRNGGTLLVRDRLRTASNDAALAVGTAAAAAYPYSYIHRVYVDWVRYLKGHIDRAVEFLDRLSLAQSLFEWASLAGALLRIASGIARRLGARLGGNAGGRLGRRSAPPSRFRTPSALRSREAALAAADEAASKGAQRGAAAGLDTGSGTFSGLSNKAGGGRIHPEVQRALDDIPPSLRSDFHAGCAEPRAISEALYAGADLRGSVMTTVLAGGRRHGVLKPACPSCKRLLEHFGIVDGAR
jgi:hypothetical protein